MSTRGPRLTRATLSVLVCAGLALTSACDFNGGDSAGQSGEKNDGGGFLGLGGGEPDAVSATVRDPGEPAVVLAQDGAGELSAAASQTFFDTAPVVVLAGEGEQLRAASAGAVLGVPVLIDGPDVKDEINRLDAEVALAIGPVADPGIDVVVPQDDAQLATLIGAGDPVQVAPDDGAARLADLDLADPQLLVPDGSVVAPTPGDDTETTGDTAGTTSGDEATGAAAPTTPPALESDRDELPSTTRPEPAATVTVLSTGRDADLAALGTARAAGAQLLVGPHTDPRATSESVQAIAAAAPTTVVGLGADFGDADTLAWRSRTAATGVELPGGGQLALPGKTYVALYGTPSTGALGVLGEQPAAETIARAEEHAGWYAPLVEETVVPSLEIIVTVAAAEATPDGNYSNELPVESFVELVDLAAEHGQYVVLDLQPGRADFVSQAKIYEELLLRPNVGLALDPEWRLGSDQVHMTQIGQTSVDEVNQVVDYLADLTREHDLPQKVLVLHMFQTRMIPDVDQVDQSRSELAVLIHADGQGPQGAKQDTWRVLHQYAPSVKYWGWKNFYDEDQPMLSPEETVSQVDPLPDFISYQ
ncbi:hypothetical protein [Ornithinimicrobium avium]|uniref:Lipoprotein n=1 Tax=Ornithinimicrobium avium TaxID=2283195 RepID=A0A345NL13_9MICO|nr:hypothetical protein [Ornithinimicrobium avium]AXH95721.1 hypothetical protein DV701_05920 [Ornithinimicrobium avium]